MFAVPLRTGALQEAKANMYAGSRKWKKLFSEEVP